MGSVAKRGTALGGDHERPSQGCVRRTSRIRRAVEDDPSDARKAGAQVAVGEGLA